MAANKNAQHHNPATTATTTPPAAPAPVTPDGKDWTWVLDTACPDCQFTADDVPAQSIAGLIPDQVARWQLVLSRPDVAIRPQIGAWSPLEYACHVRDVYGLFTTRTRLLRTEDSPTFADWDQDDAALSGKYWAEEPANVAQDLAAAAASYASVLNDVPDSAWERRGLRSNGSAFTLTTLTQYFRHDLTHHLWDVQG